MPPLHKFYILSAMFNASRMGIGATSVIYMMSYGVSLGDIAVIKLIQALVVVLSEVPTGLIADVWGRRSSILMACSASAISFCCFIFCPFFYGFVSAEVFNGLAIALWSGAFDAWVIDETRAGEKGGSYIEALFARISSYNSLATMCGGLLGGIAASYNMGWPFWGSLAAMVSVIFFILFFVKKSEDDEQIKHKSFSIKQFLRHSVAKMLVVHSDSWKFVLTQVDVRSFLMISIGIQFAIQPTLHYWQPYFQSLSTVASAKLMGWIFFSYVATQFVASSWVARMLKQNRLKPVWVNYASYIGSVIGFLGMSVASDLFIGLTFFVLLQVSMNVLRNNLSAGFNRFLEAGDRATILSIVSFVSRLGMIVNLLAVRTCFMEYEVSSLFLISMLAMICFFPMLICWHRFLLLRMPKAIF